MGLEWDAVKNLGREGLSSQLPEVLWGQTSETVGAPILSAIVADS